MGSGTGIHSEEYCKAVWEKLHATNGTNKEIITALDKMARILENGEQFWPSSTKWQGFWKTESNFGPNHE